MRGVYFQCWVYTKMSVHSSQFAISQLPPQFPAFGGALQNAEQVLGNQQAQARGANDTPAERLLDVDVLAVLFRQFAAAPPRQRLEALKRHFFAPENRETRIANALRALHTASRLRLTREEWIAAAESPEFEEEL